MRKLVIILPVLISVCVCTGFAMGITPVGASGNDAAATLLNAPAQAGSIAMLIPFASTADDGGALGEKAKVMAMRRQLNAGNPLFRTP